MMKWMVVAVALAVPAFASAADAPMRRSITVNGDAEVKVAPDQVILSLAVETLDKDLLLAKKQNDDRVKKILAVAEKFKIEPKHVQTDQISISPRYENYQNRAETFKGYEVKKSIVICLKDLNRFEELLTEVLKAGTNSVPGIEFQSTSLRMHRDKARAMAVKAAREKAVEMATVLGAKVGRPYTMQENQSHGYQPRLAYQNVSNESASNGESDSAASGFAPGQISIRAGVTIDFDLD